MNLAQPAMKGDEIEMLTRHLLPGITYLEFGCGGSTILALARGAAPCHSVDSDPAWIARLREQETVAQAEASGRLTFHHADLGPLLSWGMPADKTRLAHWPSYFLDVWGQIDGNPDVVLIDGRFRTACALVAMTLCPADTAIFMHDFFDSLAIRANYRTLLDVAEIVEQTSNLVSLRRKRDVSQSQLLARLPPVWTDFA